MIKIEIELYPTALEAVNALYQRCVDSGATVEAQVNQSSDPLLCWSLGEGGTIPYLAGDKLVSSSDFRIWSKGDAYPDADWLDQQLPASRELTLAEFLARALPGINVDAALQKLA